MPGNRLGIVQIVGNLGDLQRIQKPERRFLAPTASNVTSKTTPKEKARANRPAPSGVTAILRQPDQRRVPQPSYMR